MPKVTVLKTQSFITLLVLLSIFFSALLLVTQNINFFNIVSAQSSSNSTKAASVASAAYSKCMNNGGFVTTSRRGNSGYYNVCNFADDMSCELYALYDGQCPVGGVKTIGYSTTGQVFCALRGGQPQGKDNGQCKMPDGKVCSTISVYNGTCNSTNNYK